MSEKEQVVRVIDETTELKILNKEIAELIKKYKEYDEKLDSSMRRLYFLENLFSNRYYEMTSEKIDKMKKHDFDKLNDAIAKSAAEFYRN